MTTIVTRAGKGSPLTHTEVDTNFTNLNTAKLETAAIPLGTLQAPSVSFLNDSDTGIFCPQGGNSLAIATGAQYAITCTSTQAVGIKTANPQKALHVAGATRVGADDATDAFLEIGEGATGNRNSYIDIVGDTTYTDYGLRFIRNNTGANATSEIKHRGTGNLNFTTQEAGAIQFNTTNSPRVTIDSSGRLLVGTSSSRNHTSLGNPQLQIEGIAYAQSSIGLTNNQNVADGSYIVFNKTRGTSVGSNTIVQASDSLGAIWFQGTDGSASVLSSAIACVVEGTPAANKIASRLVFSTTADGASSPTERARIPNGGGLCVGSTVNPNALTQTSGIRLGSSTIASHDFINLTTSPVTIANGVGIGGLAFVQAYNTSTGAQYVGLIMWRSGVVAVVSESNALGFALTYSVSGSTLLLQTASGTITGSAITFAS